MALAQAAQECCFVRQLLISLGVVLTHPTVMYEDNKSCIHVANNEVTSNKSKHIDVRYHFVRDLIKTGAIRLQWCDTKDMLADALTKFTLPTALHAQQVSRMMNGTYGGPCVED